MDSKLFEAIKKGDLKTLAEALSNFPLVRNEHGDPDGATDYLKDKKTENLREGE